MGEDGRIARLKLWAVPASTSRVGKERDVAGDVSFDVVSDFDEQELRNALDQVRREVQQRYDFKGAHVDLTQEKDGIVLVTDAEMRAKAISDLIESKAVRRNLSLKIFEWGQIVPAGGNKVRQEITLRRGLPDDLAASSSSRSATSSPRSSRGSRVTRSASRARAKDELQRVIARLRGLDEAVPLQFENYR